MSGDYRPQTVTAVTFTAGVWQAPLRPDKTVRITFDPRLLSWLVGRAARRSDLKFQVAQGTPPVTVELI